MQITEILSLCNLQVLTNHLCCKLAKCHFHHGTYLPTLVNNSQRGGDRHFQGKLINNKGTNQWMQRRNLGI